MTAVRSGSARTPLDTQAEQGLRRDMPLVPSSSIAGRALVIVIAIMTFLACLTAGGAILVAGASQDWRGEVSSEVTIQIKPAAGQDIDVQVAKAAEAARRAPGVADVRALSRQESEKLLEPWLGNGLDLTELPIPRLIVVRMQDLTPRDIEGLRQTLAAQAPGASLDDHRLWLARLDTMADAIVLFAALLFLLMISAMAMAVGFATRGAMAGNREIIEVLHFVGAADGYISRQFQSHFLRLGLKGGLLGGALAAALFAAAAGLSAWSRNTVGGEEIGALFGAFSLGMAGYAAILGVAVAIAVLTGAISRIIVFRHLRRLQ
ncbi:MAG: ABC transporter permease [Roseiarcus sp.]|jgi:cell division transport system permease protein